MLRRAPNTGAVSAENDTLVTAFACAAAMAGAPIRQPAPGAERHPGCREEDPGGTGVCRRGAVSLLLRQVAGPGRPRATARAGGDARASILPPAGRPDGHPGPPGPCSMASSWPAFSMRRPARTQDPALLRRCVCMRRARRPPGRLCASASRARAGARALSSTNSSSRLRNISRSRLRRWAVCWRSMPGMSGKLVSPSPATAGRLYEAVGAA